MAGANNWDTVDEEAAAAYPEYYVDDAPAPGAPGQMPTATDIGAATAQAQYDIYHPASDPEQFRLAKQYAMAGDNLDKELEDLLGQRDKQIPSTVERLKAARARLEGRPLLGNDPNTRLRVMAAAGADGTWADNSAARAKGLLAHDQNVYNQETQRQGALDVYDDAIEGTQTKGIDAQITALQKRIAERNDLRQKYMGMRPPAGRSGGAGTAEVKAGLQAEEDQVQVNAQMADLDQLIEWGDAAASEGVSFSGPTSWQAFSPYLGGLTEKIFGPGSKEQFVRQTGGFGDEMRQKAERITQASLRPILGAQFTQVEGQNLLARAYDVTKDWPVNKARMMALRYQLENLSDVNRARIAAIRSSPPDRMTAGARRAAYDLKMDLEYAMERAGDAAMQSLGLRPGGAGAAPAADAGQGYDEQFLQDMANPEYRANASADELEVYAEYLESQIGEQPAATPAPAPKKETSGIIDYVFRPSLKKAKGGAVKLAEGGDAAEERRQQALARIQAAEAAHKETSTIPASLRREIDDEQNDNPFETAIGLVPEALRGIVGGYAGYKAKPFMTDAYNAVTSNPGQRVVAQGYIDDQSEIADAVPELRRKQTTYGQSGAELIDVMPRSVRQNVVAPAMASAPAAGRQLQKGREAQNEEAKKTRIPQAVITGLSADHPYEQAYQSLKDARKAAGDPEFGAVWQAHPSMKGTRELNGLIKQLQDSAVGRIALNNARQEWTRRQRDGEVPAGSPVGRGPGGFGPYTTEYLHTIQSHLYDLMRKTEGLHSMEAQSLRNPLIEYMDRSTGGAQSPYASARANWAANSRGMEAMETGLNEVLKMRPDEFGALWATLDPVQKEHMRTGIANAIDRDVVNRASDANPAHALLNRPATKEILQIAAETPARYKAMVKRLESERDSWDIAQQEARRNINPVTEERRRRSTGNAVDNKVTRLIAGLDRLRHPMNWFNAQEQRGSEPMSRKRGEQVIGAARTGSLPEVERLARLQGRMQNRKRGAGLLGLLSGSLAAGAPYAFESDEERLERLREEARKRVTQ
jgi:hypothetical protein